MPKLSIVLNTLFGEAVRHWPDDSWGTLLYIRGGRPSDGDEGEARVREHKTH